MLTLPENNSIVNREDNQESITAHQAESYAKSCGIKLSYKTVQNRIHKRKYVGHFAKSNKGQGAWVVLVSSLPVEIQKQHLINKSKNNSLIKSPIIDLLTKNDIPKPDVDTSKIIREAVNQKEEKEKDAWEKLIRYWDDNTTNLKHGEKLTKKIKILRLYNTGMLFPEVFEILGTIRKHETIDKKVTLLKSVNWDTRVLLRKKKIVKSTKIEREDLIDFTVIKCLPNNFSVKESVDISWEKKQNEKQNISFSYHHYYRKCREFYRANPDLFHLAEKGERSLTNNWAPSVNIDKRNLKVGDRILIDGKVLQTKAKNGARYITLLARDEASGALCAGVVTKSETREATKTLLFRLVMFLGKKPLLVTPDNGSGFIASDIKEIAENLEVTYTPASVGNGPGKGGIENANKEVRKFEKYLPGYIGESLKHTLAHSNKYEKEAQDREENIMGENNLTFYDINNALIHYMEMYNDRIIRTGVNKGKKKINVFNAGKGQGVNELHLSYLMMIKRRIKATKNGIKINGIRYFHPHFYKQQKYFLVRYDLVFNEAIYVFDVETGEFLFVAKKVEGCDPIGLIFGDEETARPILEQIRLKKNLVKTTVNTLREIDNRYSKPMAEYLFEKVGYTKVEKQKARVTNIAKQKIQDAEIVQDVDSKLMLGTGTDGNVVVFNSTDEPNAVIKKKRPYFAR
jgi:hypothetical protein